MEGGRKEERSGLMDSSHKLQHDLRVNEWMSNSCCKSPAQK